MKKKLFLLVLIILMLVGCQSTTLEESTPSLTPSVVDHASPVIDGTISPGEWAPARVEYFFEDSELLLMQSEDYWYIGIRADTTDRIVVNIFIARDDEINILHASGALGTATYQEEGDAWLLKREFSWSCRDTSDSPAALEERETFLRTEGWVSTNASLGNPNESEFQIKREEDMLRLAVTFMIVPGNSPTFWPTGLVDATSRPLGELPGRINFSPDEWGVLSFSD